MLDNLDSVPWHSLRHAYGQSSDLPDLLRALASDDEDARSEALQALYGNIWHQGTVSEATAPSVPFLSELLAIPEYDGKDGILELLMLIATGRSYHEVHAEYVGKRITPAELSARVAEERTWVDAALRAVTAGWPVYVRLLAAPSDSTRARAAHLMAACRPRRADTAEELRRRIPGDNGPWALASMVLALGVTGEEKDAELVLATQRKDVPLIQLATSVALARLLPDNLPEAALARLIAATDYYNNVEPIWGGAFAWRDSPLIPDPCRLLPTLGAADRKKALPSLLKLFPKIYKASVIEVAVVLLELCCAGEQLTAGALSPEQKQVLAGIAADARVWKDGINMAQLCRRFGLPADRKAWKVLAKTG